MNKLTTTITTPLTTAAKTIKRRKIVKGRKGVGRKTGNESQEKEYT